MAVIEHFNQIEKNLLEDSEFQAVSNYFTCNLMLADDNERFILRFNNGKIVEDLKNPMPIEEFDFSIKATEMVWEEFFKQYPAPGHHEVFAAVWLGNMMIEGNMKKFMQHYTPISRLLKVTRNSINNGEGF